MKVNCRQCGKEFSTKPSYIKQGVVRCSMRCQGIARRGKPSWNKGVSTGIVPRSAFKKGHRTFNKGVPAPWATGEKHPKWKGDRVGYYALHTWVGRRLEKPSTCSHCGRPNLSGRAIHWANKSGKYLRKLSDWLRLCVSCHKKYDLDRLGKHHGATV